MKSLKKSNAWNQYRLDMTNANHRWKAWVYEGQNGQGLHKNGDFKQSGVQKSGLSYKSARKLPQKREILIVQVEFGKIISIERIE